MSVSITISGGNVVGGSTTFTRADCDNAVLLNTPNFSQDINFWCDNGSNTLEGVEVYTNALNGNDQDLDGSTLSFNAPTKVPTMSAYGLVLTMFALALAAAGRLRRVSASK